MKNVLEFSESNIKNSCIGGLNLKLKGSINDIFYQICRKEVAQIQKAGLELCKTFDRVSLDGFPYWLAVKCVFFKSHS